jgi:DNA-directed RNA polymerase specialized sigma24 family protein
MRTAHRVDLPRHRLAQVAEQLRIAGTTAVARDVVAQSPEAGPAGLNEALRDAIALLSADDRLVLELRFRDRQPLTRIAAVLKIDARPLQRRIETAKEVIRQSLLTQGISAADVETVLASADSDTADARRQHWWQLALSRVPKPSGDR